METLGLFEPAGTTAPNIDFVLSGDLNLPTGGVLALFSGLYVPILDLLRLAPLRPGREKPIGESATPGRVLRGSLGVGQQLPNVPTAAMASGQPPRPPLSARKRRPADAHRPHHRQRVLRRPANPHAARLTPTPHPARLKARLDPVQTIRFSNYRAPAR